MVIQFIVDFLFLCHKLRKFVCSVYIFDKFMVIKLGWCLYKKKKKKYSLFKKKAISIMIVCSSVPYLSLKIPPAPTRARHRPLEMVEGLKMLCRNTLQKHVVKALIQGGWVGEPMLQKKMKKTISYSEKQPLIRSVAVYFHLVIYIGKLDA